MSFTNYSIASMRVSRFIITQTGTYQDQFHRPYHSQLDGFQQNAIIDQASRTRMITPALLAPLMSNFLTPSGAPESQIIIPNGYQQQRLRYVLAIEMVDHLGTVTVLHVSGWTDHLGLSLQSRQLDPNMRFYINNISRSRQQSLQTPMGMRTTTNIVESSHVLPTATNYQGMGTAEKSFLMRPEDIMTQVDNLNLRKGLENPSDMIYDARTVMTNQTRKSSRANASATDFAANILNGYFQAANAESDSLTNTQILENAMGLVRSDIAQRDPFISWLIQDSQGASRGDSFTLRELLRFDENALNDQVFTGPDINMSNPMAGVLEQGNSSHWFGNDTETLWATTLAQSVPAYLAKAGLTKVHFRTTNDQLGSQVVTTPISVLSLTTGVNLESNWQAFKTMLEAYVLRSLSYDNNLCFRVEMRCDMLGDTQVDVGINGKNMVEYVWPTFADAQNAPVVTKDEGRLSLLAADFSTLMDEVVDASRFAINQSSNFNPGSNSNGFNANDWGANTIDNIAGVPMNGGPRI